MSEKKPNGATGRSGEYARVRDVVEVVAGHEVREKADLKARFRWQDLRVVGGLLVVIFTAGWVAFGQVKSEAQSAVKPGLEAQKGATDAAVRRLDRVEAEQAAQRLWMLNEAERSAKRYDSLQQVILTGRPDPERHELAKPSPPPFLLDGGA